LNTPRLVYLDSSDWSNLAEAAGNKPFAARTRWLDIKRRLLAVRDSRRAEFRFSQTIVTEAYPTTASHEASGLRRARAIAELCGPLCLLESNMLAHAEIRRLAAGERPPFDRAIALRDDGAWHSDPDELGGTFGTGLMLDARTMVRDTLKEDYPVLGKKRRRAVEDILVDGKGRLTGPARERFLDPTISSEVEATFAARMRLPPETPGLAILSRVMSGELPPSDADDWLIGLLRDLPTLFSLAATREQAEQMFGRLRVAGRGISGPMGEVARKLQETIEHIGLDAVKKLHAQKPPLDVRAWRGRTRDKVLAALWNEERKRRGDVPRVRGETWFALVDGSPFGSIPTLDTYLAAGGALMAKSAQVSRYPYKVRASDLGDVLHMSYLPYVDVFRCDGGNAAVAAAVISELGLGARLAPTIEESLAIIETESAFR